MGERIRTQELFRATNGAIDLSDTLTTDLIDLTEMMLEGSFALHTIHVGGSITVTVLVCSTKTGTFVAPTTPVTILTTEAAGSNYVSFTPPIAPYMKLLFTETAGVAVTSMDAWLVYQ